MTRTFPNFDLVWAVQLAAFCSEAYAEQLAQIESGAEPAGQIDYVLAADYALDCAFITYALGASLDDVRVWIVRAANALLDVFRLRGTTPAFPVVVIHEQGDAETVNSDRTDSSLTNSRRGLAAMYAALAAGERELAERIAEFVGDPPDASYVGPESEVITPDEQELAYGLKAFLLGQLAVAVFHTAGLNQSPALIHAQARAIQALVNEDPDEFLDALQGLLAAHAIDASQEERAREPRRLMCLPCLGLAAIALQAQLVGFHQLPEDHLYLPVGLLETEGLS